MKDIIDREREFHNAQALKEKKYAISTLSLSYESRMKEIPLVWRKIHGLAFHLCGYDLQDKRVLDFGCGAGATTIILAERKAFVTALDISEEMVNLTLLRAQKAGLLKNVEGFVGTIDDLERRSRKFDLIFCGAVLHHLPNFNEGIKCLTNLLSPKGVLVGYEPVSSILSDLARKYFPYNGPSRTEDERPITKKQLDSIRKNFKIINIYSFSLFTALERIIYSNSESLWKILEFFDHVFLKINVNLFNWHIVMIGQKKD